MAMLNYPIHTIMIMCFKSLFFLFRLVTILSKLLVKLPKQQLPKSLIKFGGSNNSGFGTNADSHIIRKGGSHLNKVQYIYIGTHIVLGFSKAIKQ